MVSAVCIIVGFLHPKSQVLLLNLLAHQGLIVYIQISNSVEIYFGVCCEVGIKLYIFFKVDSKLA